MQSLPYNKDDVDFLTKDLLMFLNLYFYREFNSESQEMNNRIAEDMFEIVLTTVKIILKELNNVKYPAIYAYYLCLILYCDEYGTNQFWKTYKKFKKTINYGVNNGTNYNDGIEEYKPLNTREGVSIYYYKLLTYFIGANGIELIKQKILNIYENKVGIAAYFELLINLAKNISDDYMKEQMNSFYSQLCGLYKEKINSNTENSNNNSNGNGGSSKKKNKKSYYNEFFSNMTSQFKKLKVSDQYLLEGTLMMIEADIQSKVTERMINGLENLCELNPGKYRYSYYNSSRNDISDEDLIKWLEEKKIIDCVFSSGVELNNQLLEKVSFYVCILFKNNKLPTYVIDRIFEFIDSQSNNSSNDSDNNNNNNYSNNSYSNDDDNAGLKLLDNLIDNSDEQCLDGFSSKIELIKDVKVVANILHMLTKRYHSINNIRSRDAYCYYNNSTKSKYEFDSDLDDLDNPMELPEEDKKKLNEFVTQYDHYNFISYCFDLICDSERDYREMNCGYEILCDYIDTVQKTVKRNIISYLYLKLASYLNDNNLEKPPMLYLSFFICSYYSKLDWFENDMKICIERLMFQFKLFYVKQKKYFESVKYSEEEKKCYFIVYEKFITSIIHINSFNNISNCYSFFVEQLKNNMIFEEEEKLVYKLLNENIKKSKDSGLFVSVIELVNKVQFSNDDIEIRYNKEIYEFYLRYFYLL